MEYGLHQVGLLAGKLANRMEAQRAHQCLHMRALGSAACLGQPSQAQTSQAQTSATKHSQVKLTQPKPNLLGMAWPGPAQPSQANTLVRSD